PPPPARVATPAAPAPTTTSTALAPTAIRTPNGSLAHQDFRGISSSCCNESLVVWFCTTALDKRGPRYASTTSPRRADLRLFVAPFTLFVASSKRQGGAAVG